MGTYTFDVHINIYAVFEVQFHERSAVALIYHNSTDGKMKKKKNSERALTAKLALSIVLPDIRVSVLKNMSLYLCSRTKSRTARKWCYEV